MKSKGQGRKKTLLRLISYGKKYYKTILLAFASIIVSTGLGLTPPWLIRYGIDNYILNNTPQLLWIIGALMVGVTLLQGMIDYIIRYITENIAQNIIHDIRYKLYAHLNKLSFTFYDYAQTGDIISRMTADADTLRGFFANSAIHIITNSLTIFGILIVMVIWDYRLAILYLLFLPLMIYGMYQYSTKVRPIFKKVRQKFGQLTQDIQEDIVGIEIIKLFGRENQEYRDFQNQNQQYANLNIQAAKISALWMPYVNFFMGVGTVLVIWYGGRLVISDIITLGTLVGFTSYIAMLLRPIRQTGMIINFSNQALASAGRIFSIFDIKPEIRDADNAYPLSTINGDVKFEEVSFTYSNGKKALDGINLHAKPGQTIAIVGPTGAGKTSLIHLIPRFYDPAQGKILIDNHDISKVATESLRAQIGIILQETFLFAASIKENISYGKPNATMEEIRKCAQTAQIDEFILSLPLGYETPVGERGVTLSGGQKQRLAMARVLLINPRLLILDEPTSSVDVKTEEKIQQALQEVTKGRTTFIIAHRLWTVKNADQILVLNEGKIVEQGTHDELLQINGFYSEVHKNKKVGDIA